MKTRNLDDKFAEISESSVRRKAARRLWRLTKYGERSRWYRQYGPYSLSNERNLITHCGLSLEEASEILDGIEPLRRGIDYFPIKK